MFGSIGIPHGFCFMWNPGLLWLHVLSDSLIALAYFLIPVVLLRIVRRRKDIPYNGILLCFGAFIVACGITHIFEVVTLWKPVYWVSGTMKAITAAISLTTFVVLVRLAPAIEALPSAQRLEAAHLQLDSVLESMTACVFAVDCNWKLTYLNGNAKARLKVRGSVLGKTMFEAFPAQAPETLAYLRKAMETRKAVEFDSYYEPFDLSTEVTASPWSDGGLTIFFNDVSEQKKLQRELDKERDLRERRIEALALMAGGLAHEISNPLGIIHARANDLAESIQELKAGQAFEPQMVAEACESIVNTSDRAIRILSGLRMFARDGRGDPLEEVETAVIVRQTVHLVQQRYAAQGIVLSIDLPEEELSVRCREVQIGQVLLNLLNNAFDAVNTTPDGERWVKLEVSSTVDRVIIDVIDSGPGVLMEHRAHLMKPFFTTKPMGAGIGIGLSLSQAIAHDHGGSLVLASDGPTCFRLTLPRSTTAAEIAA